jgi:hypothetical protein
MARLVTGIHENKKLRRILRLGTWMNVGDLYELENRGPLEHQEDKAKRRQSTHLQDEKYCVGKVEVILNERRQK